MVCFPLHTLTEELVFSDEIPAIQAEVDRLIVEKNINKIIALGHAGHNMDKKIAKEVQGVDIVVGGHSNTFLYNGEANFYPLCNLQDGFVAMLTHNQADAFI